MSDVSNNSLSNPYSMLQTHTPDYVPSTPSIFEESQIYENQSIASSQPDIIDENYIDKIALENAKYDAQKKFKVDGNTRTVEPVISKLSEPRNSSDGYKPKIKTVNGFTFEAYPSNNISDDDIEISSGDDVSDETSGDEESDVDTAMDETNVSEDEAEEEIYESEDESEEGAEEEVEEEEVEEEEEEGEEQEIDEMDDEEVKCIKKINRLPQDYPGPAGLFYKNLLLEMIKLAVQDKKHKFCHKTLKKVLEMMKHVMEMYAEEGKMKKVYSDSPLPKSLPQDYPGPAGLFHKNLLEEIIKLAVQDKKHKFCRKTLKKVLEMMKHVMEDEEVEEDEEPDRSPKCMGICITGCKRCKLRRHGRP